MAKTNRLDKVIASLRGEETFLEAQLGKVRDAIAALGGVKQTYQRKQKARKVKSAVRKVRKMTAAQKAEVSKRMKKYWAARKKKR